MKMIENDDINIQMTNEEGKKKCKPLVREATSSSGALALEFLLVGRKSSIPDLLLFGAIVCFRQTMSSTKLQGAVWTFTDNLNSSIPTMLLCTRAKLAALLRATA